MKSLLSFFSDFIQVLFLILQLSTQIITVLLKPIDHSFIHLFRVLLLWWWLFVMSVFNVLWFTLFIAALHFLMSFLSWLSIWIPFFHILFLLILILLFIIFLFILIIINGLIAWNSVSFDIFPHLIQQFFLVLILATDWHSAWEVKENRRSDGTHGLVVEWD